jgi:putative endonuclease
MNELTKHFYREKQIQKWSRKKKEALIHGMTEELQQLAECMNESHHKNFAFDSAQVSLVDNRKVTPPK